MDQTTQSLSFLDPRPTEHKINDQTTLFYPITVGMAFELRTVGRSAAQALSTFFTDTNQDYGSVDRRFGKEGSDEGQEMVIESITPALAELRYKQRTQAIDSLIESFLNEDNKILLGKIILSSLKNTDTDPSAFIETLPLPALGQLLIGVAKANKEVLGPLAGKVESLAAQAVTTVERKIQENQENQEEVTKPETTSTPG